MKKILTFIVDIVFPPTDEEKRLREISPEDFAMKVRKSPAPPLSFIIPCVAYKDSLVRELIWQIKYKKNRKALEIGAFILHRQLMSLPHYPITLVPIPISKKRRRERGYNQCELLVNEILKLEKHGKLKKDFEVLTREIHHDRQTLKNRKERIENSEHIFKVNKPPTDEYIIIIDDVVTTGSTLKEARETFIKAGFKNIVAIAIAH